MRFIKEFFKPRLKCSRLGHVPDVRQVTIRKAGDSYTRKVCIDYTCEIVYCSRCGKRLTDPRNLVEKDWWSKVFMPKSLWDDMRRDGFIILNS